MESLALQFFSTLISKFIDIDNKIIDSFTTLYNKNDKKKEHEIKIYKEIEKCIILESIDELLIFINFFKQTKNKLIERVPDFDKLLFSLNLFCYSESIFLIRLPLVKSIVATCLTKTLTDIYLQVANCFNKIENFIKTSQKKNKMTEVGELLHLKFIIINTIQYHLFPYFFNKYMEQKTTLSAGSISKILIDEENGDFSDFELYPIINPNYIDKASKFIPLLEEDDIQDFTSGIGFPSMDIKKGMSLFNKVKGNFNSLNTGEGTVKNLTPRGNDKNKSITADKIKLSDRDFAIFKTFECLRIIESLVSNMNNKNNESRFKDNNPINVILNSPLQTKEGKVVLD